MLKKLKANCRIKNAIPSMFRVAWSLKIKMEQWEIFFCSGNHCRKTRCASMYIKDYLTCYCKSNLQNIKCRSFHACIYTASILKTNSALFNIICIPITTMSSIFFLHCWDPSLNQNRRKSDWIMTAC